MSQGNSQDISHFCFKKQPILHQDVLSSEVKL